LMRVVHLCLLYQFLLVRADLALAYFQQGNGSAGVDTDSLLPVS
jgi:hypothetical protein